jgi:hypothetical protein
MRAHAPAGHGCVPAARPASPSMPPERAGPQTRAVHRRRCPRRAPWRDAQLGPPRRARPLARRATRGRALGEDARAARSAWATACRSCSERDDAGFSGAGRARRERGAAGHQRAPDVVEARRSIPSGHFASSRGAVRQPRETACPKESFSCARAWQKGGETLLKAAGRCEKVSWAMNARVGAARGGAGGVEARVVARAVDEARGRRRSSPRSPHPGPGGARPTGGL